MSAPRVPKWLAIERVVTDVDRERAFHLAERIDAIPARRRWLCLAMLEDARALLRSIEDAVEDAEEDIDEQAEEFTSDSLRDAQDELLFIFSGHRALYNAMVGLRERYVELGDRFDPEVFLSRLCVEPDS